MAVRFLLALALLISAGHRAAAQPSAPVDQIVVFVERVRQLVLAGNGPELAVLAEGAANLEEFIRSMTPAPTALVIKERDRTPLTDGGQRLLLEIFAVRGAEAHVSTWQLELVPAGDTGPTSPPLRVRRLARLTVVSGLFALSLDVSRQYDVRNLTLKGPDLTLEMPAGAAFVARTPGGPTAVVLLGSGQMRFSPPDPSERTQIRIFAGEERLAAEFDAVLLRIPPSDFAASFAKGTLTERAPVPADVRRASGYFEDYIGRTLSLDLNDLSRDRWSLLPQEGDLIAEVRTRRFGTLTYARMQSDAEDVSFFDRRRRKNIAIYASQEKLASRGRFFSEDDLLDYDVLSYHVEADFSPERLWIDGRARVTVRIVAPAVTSLTLRIAEPLIVRNVQAQGFGRLMYLRVVGQNAVIVNFPTAVTKGTPLTLQVVYGGRLEPQELDREAVSLHQEQEAIILEPEPRYIYSNRSYWYPQSTVADYATAKLDITVPSEYGVVASGTPAGPPTPAAGVARQGDRPRRTFTFSSDKPLRYLAFVISRFIVVARADLALTPGGKADAPDAGLRATSGDALALAIHANPRQSSRGRSMAERSKAILEFYASILGEVPYPSFTLALSESDLPGGHSPGYFAILNQPLPTSPFVWRNDPVSFDGYPTFFLAHELGHQWWGQSVGWKNYHEQWISEGFAQYFAAMYAEKERGTGTFEDVLKQMRRWGIEASPQGPVYLGYRLGHIKSDSRVFRAVIYNKAAMVLHMLRRLLGDDAFFRGLRAFYGEWQFRKAGTDDFRVSMEKVTNQDLRGFFEAWIHGTGIPQLQLRHSVQGSNAVVTIEQRGDVIPVPVTITLEYAGGNTEQLTIPVMERSVSRTLPLSGTLRGLVVNQEHSLAVFER